MKKVYSAALAAWLISPSFLYAAETDPVQVEGQLNLGVRSVNGGEDSAYFHEFKDESDGTFGSLLLDAYKKNYYLGAEAENFGLTDQYYSLHAGDYRNFSFKGFYNEIPHNISFDALTPFTGIGTKSLNLPVQPAPTNTGLWQQFDYDFTRKQYGGEMKINLNSPFYIKVGAKREERDGVKPLGAGYFTPGAVEMPEPIDYKTDDLTVEGGYLSKDLVASVSGYLSSFNNKNLYLAWEDPFATAFPADFPTLSTLPPNNDYGKVVGEATWKALPMSSVLAVRGSYSHLENDFTYSDVGLSNFTTAVLGANGFDFTTPTFDGSIIYYNGSATLTSRPMRSVDTRLYYNYLDKANDSTVITTIEPSGDVATNSDTLFGYRKN
nr:MtrB/PioB family outer membrane beta-barrel protein [Desulfobacteraceae bacterium]